MTQRRGTKVAEADFKAAMRKLAATVTLVTTSDDGHPHGMPATAVTSLSANPPSLLVCINRSASMHGPTSRSRHFCINMLTQDQASLCSEFGLKPSNERFSVGEWERGMHDLPYMVASAAAIFCTVEEAVDYGTHTIFVGRIDAVEVGSHRDPLVYQEGNMGSFVPLPAVHAAQQRAAG